MSQLTLFSPPVPRRRSVNRYVLGGLLAFGALNAFGGGYYGMAGAESVPTEWLEGSPFDDYFVPGFILFGAVGGSLLAAAIAVFANLPMARVAAVGAAAILFGWLVIETLMIGYVSWMQPATAAGGLVILFSRGDGRNTRRYEMTPFTLDDARSVGERLGIDWGSSAFDVEQFRAGMDIELEHGTREADTDVTGDDPLLTGKIALAHLRELPDYYTRLARMEAEGEAALGDAH